MGEGKGQGYGGGKARGKTMRVAVPAMPMPLAVLCCVLNFLVPGLGTIIAGFSACCCSRNEDMTMASRCGSCCTSLAIGLLQLLTTALLLLGWVWSCFWGVFFLGMSSEYYHDNPPDGGTVLHSGNSTVVVPSGYPRSYPIQTQPQPTGYLAQPGYQQPQPGYPAVQPQAGYGQPYQGYNQPQTAYSQPQPGSSLAKGYGEPPPPYTETETTPSAPPAEKM